MAISLIKKAKIFATKHHSAVGQKRKYTGEDYIVHPIEVAAIVSSVTGDEEMIAAAYLHDTVEDTEATIEDIEREFGPCVADLVENLTDVSKPEDGNRKVRKEIDRQHTSRASARAKTIKLADLISNSRTILLHDPEFSVTYMREKALLLQVLKGGDATLFARASDIVNEFMQDGMVVNVA